MGQVVLNGATSGSTTLTPVDAVTATITLPLITSTLATLSGTETLSNKTITATGNISTSGTAVISSGNSVESIGPVQVHAANKLTVAQESASTSVITAYGAAAGTPGNLFLNTRGSTGTSGGGVVCVGLAKGYSGAQAFDVNASPPGDYLITFANSNATPYGIFMKFTGAAPNGTANYFLDCRDNTGTARAQLYSNGGLANYSANNVNLSDEREKKNIELAPNYLDRICSIPVKTFLFNDQTDTELNLGVIAQDVQVVAPELVTESDWGTKDAPKMRLSIYQTDFQYALMKCIQEQQAIIQSLTARIATLEAK